MVRIGQLHVSLESREIQLNGEPLRIGTRAFDILELLIRAEGQVVSKDEIMRRVWPDTVVEENNLQVHIAALRKVLGDDRDVIRTVPGRGYRLLPGSAGPAVQRQEAVHAAHAAVPDLSYSAAALIGRESLVAEVTEALDAARVVTLVGAGGIGKTRIAVEVAGQLRARFPDGVVFVALAPVSDPRFAVDELVSALGMKLPAGRRLLRNLADAMVGRRVLIVLDNCEHIMDAAAEIACTMTAGNPLLGVLATSREALRIKDEILHRVPPLEVPAEDSTGEQIVQTSAVRLFLARARGIDPGFASDERSLVLTGLVCRRLDGIPLAIELAAARAAVLGIEVLAGHLDERFRILGGGFRSALPRHQTLKATLDWSYRLLDDVERTLLRWLGVFLNGFAFEAVCHVMKEHGFSRTQILDALDGLVSKSLVNHDSHDRGARYRMLQTTRAYALQQLDDNGEHNAASVAHAAYCCTIFDRAPHHRAECPLAEWLAEFRHELGNLRAALDWAFSPRGDRAVGIELAAVAVPCLFDVSLVDECCERARVALNALDALSEADAARVPPRTTLWLVASYAASLVYAQGPVQAVHDAWSEVLSLAALSGDTEFEARALWGLWNACQYGGNAQAALLQARRFSALVQQIDNSTWRVIGRRIEGIALHYAGEQRAAREQLEGMLNAYVRPAHRWSTVGFRIDHGIAANATLARVLWVQGETARALELAARTLEAAQQYEHDMVTCYVLVEAFIPIALLMNEGPMARHGLAMLRARASQAGFAIWLSACECFEEYLLSKSAACQARLPQFGASLGALRKLGFLAPLTLLLAQFACALLASGRRDDAAETIDDALQHCERTGERWYYAELCRIKGEILLAANRIAEAESWFIAALGCARRQGAGEFERRAVASMSAFRNVQRGSCDARLPHPHLPHLMPGAGGHPVGAGLKCEG
ncbi:MAG TPA: winged helix-turn-helix domain-containing protein [Paraburkholderia sp.]|jgi:predicted ATPase/DNA-binding winged helix-turn-helix (wHTH) protein|nr:winged helix-turn-helix domain-containing protein [Paraburkholderia sp.]